MWCLLDNVLNSLGVGVNIYCGCNLFADMSVFVVDGMLRRGAKGRVFRVWQRLVY